MKNLRTQKGFTLVEVMISMIVVGVIMVGVANVFKEQAAVAVASEDESEMQSAVQGAAYMIRNAIVMGGFGRQGNQSFGFTNVFGTAAGADSLSVFSASQDGSAITTFVLTKQPIVTGNTLTLHCKGADNTGGFADPARDPILVPGLKTYLVLKDAFKGTLLTGIGPANPLEVKADSGPSCLPHPTPDVDLNNDSDPDPVVIVETVQSFTSVPRGATVYGYRVTAPTNPMTTFSLDTARNLLLQNGMPILYGVEDFQVQFQTNDGVWQNDLTGINQITPAQVGPQLDKQIAQIAIALVVRYERLHEREARGTVDQVVTFDHTLQLTATTKEFNRKQHIFYVRPKNHYY